MTSATASLPGLNTATNASANAQSGLSAFLSVAGSLTSSGDDSPLHGILSVLDELNSSLNIDVSGLSEKLPQALNVIENALPADSLIFIEQLEDSYREVNDFLTTNDLVKQIQPGVSFEETALAIVDEVTDLFRNRLTDLGSSLVDAETLNQVKTALETIDTLAGGGNIEAEELLDFLADNLAGVAADLLSDVETHLDSTLNFIQPLSAASLDAAMSSASNSLAQALQNLANGVKDFDAADAAAYPALEALLDAYSSTLEAAFSALETLYSSLNNVVSAPQWARLFETYTEVLNAVPLPEGPTVDDAVDELVELMESLLSRLTMSLSAKDLAAQVTGVSASIHNLFADSPLHQVRQILIDFIGKIEQALAAVPTEEVQQAVDGMLSRVGQEIQDLNIDQVRSSIENGFETANNFIDNNLDDNLLNGVTTQLTSTLDRLNDIPIAELGNSISTAVQQAEQVITDLENSLSSGLDEIKNLLASLDSVDFKPVSSEVIDEIQTLKVKLQAINPDALSDVEKLAIQTGLAVLSAIDLEGEIVFGLKDGYAGISDELANAIQSVLDAWLEFRRRIGVLDASALAAPITGLLDEINNLIQGLNGNLLIAPLQELIDKLMQQLQSLSPAALLDPLQAPYDRMMQTIERANPDVWVAPLRTLYSEIDRLVTLIDITPLLTRLEEKEQQLFAEANQAIADALDAVQLPPPLDVFYAQIKTLIQGISGAVFGDPDGTLRNFSSLLSDSVRPSTMFQPLDAAFDRLIAATETLPAEQVLAALESLRQGLGAALPAMNPAHILSSLRDAEGRLASMSPANLAGAVKLPALRARLEVGFEGHSETAAAQASLLARFDIALAPLQISHVDAGLHRLHLSHEQLLNGLRQQINVLDAQGAQLAYQRLDSGLHRLLPDFLLQSTSLQFNDIQASLASLRPSTKARRLDTLVDRFLAEVQPLQASLDEAVNGFFSEIRQAALLLYPGDIKDAVAGVYDRLREKLDILNPDELAADLRSNVWEPLIDPLNAISPAALKAQLQALFDNLLTKIAVALDGLLEELMLAIDVFLSRIREAISQTLGALSQQIDNILEGVNDLIEQLDNLIIDELFNRLLNLLSNLKISFNLELDRVRNEFDAMLNAIPLSGSASASVDL